MPVQHEKHGQNRLTDIPLDAAIQTTLLLYAPPHGLAAILADAAEILDGSRQCVVAREMTKVLLTQLSSS